MLGFVCHFVLLNEFLIIVQLYHCPSSARYNAEAWHGGHVRLGAASTNSSFTDFRAEAFTVKVVLPVQPSPNARRPRPGRRQLSSISKTFLDSVTPDVILVVSEFEL